MNSWYFGTTISSHLIENNGQGYALRRAFREKSAPDIVADNYSSSSYHLLSEMRVPGMGQERGKMWVLVTTSAFFISFAAPNNFIFPLQR